MKKAMKKASAMAVCEDCDYTYSNPVNMNAQAAKHAKFYGHRVNFELKFEGYYDGRKEKDETKKG